MGVVYMPCVGDLVLETTAFTQGESTVFLFMVGYDYFSPRTYHLMINMHCSTLGNEFMFGLTTVDRFKGIIENTFDSTVANDIIPKPHRSGVLRVLLEQADKVVKYTGVDHFFMTTYLENLSGRPMDKYDMLTHVFARSGFNVTRSEPKPGKHLWQMNRTPAAGVP